MTILKGFAVRIYAKKLRGEPIFFRKHETQGSFAIYGIIFIIFKRFFENGALFLTS